MDGTGNVGYVTMADGVLPDIVIHVTGDISDFLTNLETVKAELQDLATTPTSAPIGADVSEFQRQMIVVGNALSAFEATEPSTKISVDVGDALTNIGLVQTALAGLLDRTVHVAVDAEDLAALGHLEAVDTALGALKDRKVNAEVGNDTALEHVAAVVTAINALNDRNLTIEVANATALENIAAVQTALDALGDRTVRVRAEGEVQGVTAPKQTASVDFDVTEAAARALLNSLQGYFNGKDFFLRAVFLPQFEALSATRDALQNYFNLPDNAINLTFAKGAVETVETATVTATETPTEQIKGIVNLELPDAATIRGHIETALADAFDITVRTNLVDVAEALGDVTRTVKVVQETVGGQETPAAVADTVQSALREITLPREVYDRIRLSLLDTFETASADADSVKFRINAESAEQLKQALADIFSNDPVPEVRASAMSSFHELQDLLKKINDERRALTGLQEITLPHDFVDRIRGDILDTFERVGGSTKGIKFNVDTSDVDRLMDLAHEMMSDEARPPGARSLAMQTYARLSQMLPDEEDEQPTANLATDLTKAGVAAEQLTLDMDNVRSGVEKVHQTIAETLSDPAVVPVDVRLDLSSLVAVVEEIKALLSVPLTVKIDSDGTEAVAGAGITAKEIQAAFAEALKVALDVDNSKAVAQAREARQTIAETLSEPVTVPVDAKADAASIVTTAAELASAAKDQTSTVRVKADGDSLRAELSQIQGDVLRTMDYLRENIELPAGGVEGAENLQSARPLIATVATLQEQLGKLTEKAAALNLPDDKLNAFRFDVLALSEVLAQLPAQMAAVAEEGFTYEIVQMTTKGGKGEDDIVEDVQVASNRYREMQEIVRGLTQEVKVLRGEFADTVAEASRLTILEQIGGDFLPVEQLAASRVELAKIVELGSKFGLSDNPELLAQAVELRNILSDPAIYAATEGVTERMKELRDEVMGLVGDNALDRTTAALESFDATVDTTAEDVTNMRLEMAKLVTTALKLGIPPEMRTQAEELVASLSDPSASENWSDITQRFDQFKDSVSQLNGEGALTKIKNDLADAGRTAFDLGALNDQFDRMAGKARSLNEATKSVTDDFIKLVNEAGKLKVDADMTPVYIALAKARAAFAVPTEANIRIGIPALLAEAATAMADIKSTAAMADATVKISANITPALEKLAALKASVAGVLTAGGGGADAAGGGGGTIGGGLLGDIMGGGGKGFRIPGTRMRIPGGAKFGSLGSMAGFGTEHIVATAGGLAGSLGGAALGGGLLAAAGLTTTAVGMGTDMAGMGQAAKNAKGLSADMEALDKAVAVYGANSKQAQTASATLAYDIGNITPVAQAATLALGTALHNLSDQFKTATGQAQATGAEILTQFVGVAHDYVPVIGKFAAENMGIIKSNIQPFLGWLKDSGSQGGLGIFTQLETAFQKGLPTSIHAVTTAFELFMKTVSHIVSADGVGGLMRGIDNFVTKMNGADFGKWISGVDTLINQFHVWLDFFKVLGSDLYMVLKMTAGLAAGSKADPNGIIPTLTKWLTELQSALRTTTKSSALGTIFSEHKKEVLTIIDMVIRIGVVFGQAYIAAAPVILGITNLLLTVLDTLLKITSVKFMDIGQIASVALGIGLIASKMGILGPLLKGASGDAGLMAKAIGAIGFKGVISGEEMGVGAKAVRGAANLIPGVNLGAGAVQLTETEALTGATETLNATLKQLDGTLQKLIGTQGELAGTGAGAAAVLGDETDILLEQAGAATAAFDANAILAGSFDLVAGSATLAAEGAGAAALAIDAVDVGIVAGEAATGVGLLLPLIGLALTAVAGGIYYLATHWTQSWHAIKTAVGDAVSWVKGHLAILAIAFAPVLLALSPLILGGYALFTHWKTIWGGIKTLVSDAVQFVRTHLFLIPIAIATLVPVLIPLLAAGYLLYTNWKTVWGGIQTVVRAAVAGVMSAWKSFMAWFGGRKGEMTTIVHGVGHAFQDLSNWVRTAVQTVQGVWGGFTKWIAAHSAEIRAVLQPIGQTFVYVFGLIVGTVRTALQVLGAIISPALSAIEAVFHIVWAAIALVVKVAFDFIVMTVRVTWDILVSIFNVFLDLLSGHWGRAWDDIKTVVTQVTNAIGSFLEQAWNAIREFVKSVALDIWHFITAVWHDILRDVKDIFGSVVAFFGSAASQIIKAFEGADKWLTNIGRQIVQGLIDGVKGMFGAIGNVVSDLAGKFLGGLGSLLGIASPSTITRDMGLNLGQGLADGVNNSTGTVQTAAQNLSATATGALKVSRTDANKAGASVTQGVADGITSQSAIITNAAKTISDQLTKAFSSLSGVDAAAKAVNGLGTIFKNLKSVFQDVSATADSLQNVPANVAAVTTALGDLLTKTNGKGIADQLGLVEKAFKDVGDPKAITKVADAMGGIGKLFDNLGGAATSAAQVTDDNVNAILASLGKFQANASVISQSIKDIVGAFSNSTAAPVAKAGAPGASPTKGKPVDQFKDLDTATTGLDKINKLLTDVSTMFDTFGKVAASASSVTKDNLDTVFWSIVKMTTAISPLLTAVKDLGKGLDALGPSTDKNGKAIAGTGIKFKDLQNNLYDIATLFQKVSDVFGKVKGAIFSSGGIDTAAMAPLKTAIKAIGDALAGLPADVAKAQGAVTALSNLISAMGSAISDQNGVFKTAGSELIQNVQDGMWAQLQVAQVREKDRIDTTLLNIVAQSLASAKSLKMFKDGGINLVQQLQNGFHDQLFNEFVPREKKNVSDAVSQVATALNSGTEFDTFRKAGTDLVQQLQNGFHDQLFNWFVPNETTNLNTAIGSIAGVLSSTENIQLFHSAGVNMMQGLKQGISDTAGIVATAAAQAATDALKGVHSVTKPGSPSRLYTDEGMNWMQGLAQGITGNRNLVKAAMIGAIPSAGRPAGLAPTTGGGTNMNVTANFTINAPGGNPATIRQAIETESAQQFARAALTSMRAGAGTIY